MTNEVTITRVEIDGLAQRLEQFWATLSPAQQAVLEHVFQTLPAPAESDVAGYANDYRPIVFTPSRPGPIKESDPEGGGEVTHSFNAALLSVQLRGLLGGGPQGIPGR